MLELVLPQCSKRSTPPRVAPTLDKDLAHYELVMKWADEKKKRSDLHRITMPKESQYGLRSKDQVPPRIWPASNEFRSCDKCILNQWIWEPREPKCPRLRLGTTCNHSSPQQIYPAGYPEEVPGKLV